MNIATWLRFNPALLSSALIGSLLLASCSSYRSMESASAPMAADNSTGGVMNQASVPSAAPSDSSTAESANASAEVPRSQPQLIKAAELVITVDSVKATIDAVTAIARQQQGDLLGLQDQIPQDDSRHTASVQLRVPQDKLDVAMAELAKLGTVQRQSITAEDVSNQLVDYQARLRNLQRAEATVLTIMDRSGNVGDVLKVAQELNNIRSSIEQINAQLNDLQNRVAYSTITLSMEESIALIPPQRAIPIELEETWQGATRSLSELTVDLLQLGIWLIVYSPYLLLIAGAGALGYMRLRRSPAHPEPQD
jgi:Domain of unknown function (DUF4349)